MTRKSCRSLLRIAATAFLLRCYRTSSTRSLPPRWGAPREAWASASRFLEASSRRWGDGSKCRPRSAAARPSWWSSLAMRRSSPHASDPKGSSLIMSDVARILIADDEETFLQSMGALLRREGRSEEHTSELQSQSNLVCRLLLEKKIGDADFGLGNPEGGCLCVHA